MATAVQPLLPSEQPRSNEPAPVIVEVEPGAVEPEAVGFFERTINMAEELTGIDLDGDGDIGVAGSPQQRKFKSLFDVVQGATVEERRKFFSAGRRIMELEELAENTWWLSPNVLKHKVEERDGPASWAARVVAFMQGSCVQVFLVVLLLLDVSFVAGEIFVEAYHPSCKVIRRAAFSCSLPDTTAHAPPHDSHPHVELSIVEMIVEQLVYRVTAVLGGDYAAVHAADVVADGCVAPLVRSTHEVGCDINPFWHSLHVDFSIFSLLILLIFAAEILVLLCTFRQYFFRGPGMVIDLFVISLALWLQWEVLKIELGVMNADDTWNGKDLVTLVLLFRFVRFVRVYHGITASMHSAQHKQMHKLQHTVNELNATVETLVEHVPLAKKDDIEKVYNQLRALREQLEQ